MSLYGVSGANSHLTITAPAAGGIGPGAYTVAALHMPYPFNPNTIWVAYESTNFSYRSLYFDGDMWVPQQAHTNAPSFANPPVWYWLVVTKSAASPVAPRAHYAVYTGSGGLVWVHVDVVSTQIIRSSINRFSIGDEFGNPYKGNLACLTAFTRMMTDAEVETTFARSSLNIMAANPQFFVHWPSASGISTPFTDIAGGGVETIRTGVWDVSADPPSYNFSLAPARSGFAKVWNGTSWVPHQGKTWNGTAWVNHPIKGYDGANWITAK